MFIPPDKLDAAFSLLKRDALRPGSRVLILVATDCDSLCATKILVTLLKLCYIPYSMRPVTCNEGLLIALQEELESAQSMDGDTSISSCFLINCGNTIDLASFLQQDHMQQFQPPITVYVCDSHLPAHENNVQDQEQILLFNTEWMLSGGEGSGSGSPNNSNHDHNNNNSTLSDSSSSMEISSNSSDSGSLYDGGEDDDNEGTPRGSSASSSSSALPVKFGSYFGKPVSYMMCELATQLSYMDSHLLWLGIVGVTSMYMLRHIEDTLYHKLIIHFNNEVTGLQQQQQHQHAASPSLDSAQGNGIVYDVDFKFWLYRQWNLFDSMYYSPYITSRLAVWTEIGRKKLATIFVKMGVSVEECKNGWSSMNVDVKKAVKSQLADIVANDFNLRDITFQSFYKNIGYQLQVSAADVVWAITSLLHLPPAQVTASSHSDSRSSNGSNILGSQYNAFFTAYDALNSDGTSSSSSSSSSSGSSNSNSSSSSSPSGVEALFSGLQGGIMLCQKIVSTGVTILEKQIIVRSGPFRYLFIPPSPDTLFFTTTPLSSSVTSSTSDIAAAAQGGASQPIIHLANFINDALNLGAGGASSKPKSKPLVVCCLNEQRSTFLVVGVTAYAPTERKRNKFGLAFAEAARRSNSRILCHGFDSACTVEVLRDDIKKFIDLLHSRLT